MTALAEHSLLSSTHRMLDHDMDADLGTANPAPRFGQDRPSFPMSGLPGSNNISVQAQDHERNFHADAQDSEMENGEDTAGVSPSSSGHSDDAQTAESQPQPMSVWADSVDSLAPVLNIADGSAAPLDLGTRPPQWSDTTQAQRDADRTASQAVTEAWNAAPPTGPDMEDDLDDDDDDDQSHNSDERARSEDLYPFTEDLSSPDGEELRILNSSTERSAVDDRCWEQQTFFDPKDAGFAPSQSGVIVWEISNFNGTKERPNKELVMKSPVASIGGQDWRIKLLPHGHENTERVSIYVENVSLASVASESWSPEDLSLPLIDGTSVQKQHVVAAQISIIIYNPDEPRTHEFKADAHQYSSDSLDHGWARFTATPWYELHRRQFLQRQPLLRNDKLTIKAYIRTVADPTRCLWRTTGTHDPKSSIANVGLVPLTPAGTSKCVVALWLHLRPFRQFLYQLSSACATSRTESDPSAITLVKKLLLILYGMRARTESGAPELMDLHRRLTRSPSTMHGQDDKDYYDVVRTMHRLLEAVLEELGELAKTSDYYDSVHHAAKRRLTSIFGSASVFSTGRTIKRRIEGHADIQEIVHDGANAFECSEILTIELERQVFDHEKRCWRKLLNKIELNDAVRLRDTRYILYGFVTHVGDLQSEHYQAYFRPAGSAGLWYKYSPLSVDCLTRAQAVTPHEGSGGHVDHSTVKSFYDSHYDGTAGNREPVAYVVLYVREDVAKTALDPAVEEPWEIPAWIFDKQKRDQDGEGRNAPAKNKNAPWDSYDRGKSPDAVTVDEANARAAAPTERTNLDPGPTAAGPDTGGMESAAAGTNPSLAPPAIAPANPAAPCLPQPSATPSTRPLVMNYFSQPFYQGSALANNQFHATGKHISLSGDVYTGSFAHHQRYGTGTMAYANGDVYSGEWAHDQRHGQGTHTEARTGNIYSGGWREGTRHGAGTTVWRVSEEEMRLCRICWEAQADAAFYDCGHVVACRECAGRVEDCPVCRRRVKDVVKLFYGS